MSRARKYHSRPKWPDTSQAQVEYFVREFSDSLKRIAERLARHEEAINVDPRHVKEAFGVISRLGQSRVPFYRRTEFEVGIGAFLFSLGLACPDVLTAWLGERSGYVAPAMAGLLLAGVVLTTHGWYRGRI